MLRLWGKQTPRELPQWGAEALSWAGQRWFSSPLTLALGQRLRETAMFRVEGAQATVAADRGANAEGPRLRA